MNPAVMNPPTTEKFSKSRLEVADELGVAPEDLTTDQILDYRTEDLPDGPDSPLGGEVPSSRQTETESETRRLADIGAEWAEQIRAAHKAQ